MYRTIYDEKLNQWSGLQFRPLHNPEISVGEALLNCMHAYGPKIAQVSSMSIYSRYTLRPVPSALSGNIECNGDISVSDVQSTNRMRRFLCEANEFSIFGLNDRLRWFNLGNIGAESSILRNPIMKNGKLGQKCWVRWLHKKFLRISVHCT